MNYWLVKQEPESYAWEQFKADGQTQWTGVRNFQARIHLRAMKKGDPVLYYHIGAEKSVVGQASVLREAYPDPTVEPGEKGEWFAVDLEAKAAFPAPVSLRTIKAEPKLEDIALVRNSRLSVMPLRREEYEYIVHLGGRKP